MKAIKRVYTCRVKSQTIIGNVDKIQTELLLLSVAFGASSSVDVWAELYPVCSGIRYPST